MAPDWWFGNESRGADDALSPQQRLERALHPLPLFTATGPAGAVLCASCAYTREQLLSPEDQAIYDKHYGAGRINTPEEAAKFRLLARPRIPKGRHQGGSRSMGGIFSHWEKKRDELIRNGKGGEE